LFHAQYSIPDLRFFHQGQLQGLRKRISPHLIHPPNEPVAREIQDFYEHLIKVLRDPVLKSGEWQSISCLPAWEGNGSWDSLVAHAWTGTNNERILVAVNYAPHSSQCYLNLPFSEIKHRSVRLKDALSANCYERDGNELLESGLYLDLLPWSYHLFYLEIF